MNKIYDGGPELKHCPFCGPNVRKPVLHKDKGVKCHTCGAWGPAWEKPDGSEWNRRADLVYEPCVSIPEGHPDLNLSAWLDRRREQIGPWADYIITEVGKLESEIANMRSVPTTNNQGINP